MSDVTVGGWSFFKNVSEDDKKIFEKALNGLVGVGYTPLLVATQVVSGTNYCFLCTGDIVVPEQPKIAALVYIYQPLEGEPHVTEIKRITP